MFNKQEYLDFLSGKVVTAKQHGFDLPECFYPAIVKPHQKDTVDWAIRLGAAAIFNDFGLGKTLIQLLLADAVTKAKGGKFLICAPLGVRYQFKIDAEKIGETLTYVTNTAELIASNTRINITNYERVCDANFDITYLVDNGILTGCTLDEGSGLRNMDTKTTNRFMSDFKNVVFKYVATATPAPNRYLEYINYAHFLGVMDRGQALTMFFKRDSSDAGNLTLLDNQKEAFWNWVRSWAIFINTPADLGYDDTGYNLPERVIIPHCIKFNEAELGPSIAKDGQVAAFTTPSKSVTDRANIQRKTVQARISKAMELVERHKDENVLLWHLREDERAEIEKQLPEVVTVYGAQPADVKEDLLHQFTDGKIKYLGTKPSIAGLGCNFQYHCCTAIYCSINDDFEEFIQALHRIYRFGQKNKVTIHVIFTEQQQEVYNNLMRKWSEHEEVRTIMSELIRQFGLTHHAQIEQLKRTMGVQRQEIKGDNYTCINNDCILELPKMPDNSVDIIATSIPFGDHYEYSCSYHDLGHNYGNNRFWQQMDFLIPQLHRVLSPGRVAVIHVKDRIRYGSMTGFGYYTIDPFSDECTYAFRKHGFHLISRITLVKDVVQENNQTNRLTHKEKVSDKAKMGNGLPEYILVFRKQQTNTSKGNSDKPAATTKEDYTRGKWQIDAHCMWKSNGDVPYTDEQMLDYVCSLDMKKVKAWIEAWGYSERYNYEFHVKLAERLDKAGKLPTTYMLLQPRTSNTFVWDDINYMNGLNMHQRLRKRENHVCPLPFDIVDRIIECFSVEGDVVLDPFAGLQTVVRQAILKNRKGIGIELNPEYFEHGVSYVKEADYKMNLPKLF